jgi:hypothetical protein
VFVDGHFQSDWKAHTTDALSVVIGASTAGNASTPPEIEALVRCVDEVVHEFRDARFKEPVSKHIGYIDTGRGLVWRSTTGNSLVRTSGFKITVKQSHRLTWRYEVSIATLL